MTWLDALNFSLWMLLVVCDVIAYARADPDIRQSKRIYRWLPGGGALALRKTRKVAEQKAAILAEGKVQDALVKR